LRRSTGQNFFDSALLAKWLKASSSLFEPAADGLLARDGSLGESDAPMASPRTSKLSEEGDTTPTSCKRGTKSKQEREKGFKPSQYKTRLCRRCVHRPRAPYECPNLPLLGGSSAR